MSSGHDARPVLDGAALALMRRRHLAAAEAVAVLEDAARDLGVDVRDLAGLVVASERRDRARRHRTLHPVRDEASAAAIGTGVGPRRWALRPPAPTDLGEAAAPPRPRVRGSRAVAGLTPREAEIVWLLGQGLSNQQIADRLFLSINSIKTYIRTAYRRAGVKTRTQALVWAFEHGLGPNTPAPSQRTEVDDGPSWRGVRPEPA